MDKIIHVAAIKPDGRNVRYLLLRQSADGIFKWFLEANEQEEQSTEISATNAEEAMLLARKFWGDQHISYRTINCGFRYTLPERDEHGYNALFHQMVSSYSSMNGIYYDEELGHNCIVNFISHEAYNLWIRLKKAKRI